MIPTDRPVVGKDLDSIRIMHGMLTADACWLFGMSITKWMHVVRQAPNEPLRDPTLALLIRFLDQHPEMSVIPKFPEAPEMFDLINKIQDVDQKRFSVLFGSESSATYRWLKSPGSRVSPAVGRLMHYLKMSLLANPPERRGVMLEEWRQTVQTEATARGVNDIFKSGSWKPKEPKPPRKRAPKKNATSTEVTT
ncbi:hypothetical protein [Paucibacter soli]|uniref:hypothetical protein n=1 Tax=Paucibacter soli TaxID=3133433 RepID=UPI0030B49C4B